LARFFFDIDDGEARTVDQDGTELPDAGAARAAALAVLPSIAQDTDISGNGREITATIRDGTGQAIFRARLSVRGEWIGGQEGGNAE
jgi:hypothetical protein